MYAKRSVLIALVALCFAAGMVLAQDAPERQPYEPDQCDVAVGNYLFFRIRTPAAGFKVAERQKLVEQRLVEIISNHEPEPVTIGWIRGKPTIFVDGVKLVTVYPRDREANGARCTQALAAIWADRVRTGLKKVWPGCRFSAGGADLAPGAGEESSAEEAPEATPGK